MMTPTGQSRRHQLIQVLIISAKDTLKCQWCILQLSTFFLFLITGGKAEGVEWLRPPHCLHHNFWGCTVLAPLHSPDLMSTHRWSSFSQFTRKSSRSRWSLFKGTIIAVNSGQFVLFDINGGNSCVAWIMNLLGTHLVRHPKRAWRVRHNETNIQFVALVVNLMVGVGATHSCSTWTRFSRFPLKYDWKKKSSVKRA